MAKDKGKDKFDVGLGNLMNERQIPAKFLSTDSSFSNPTEYTVPSTKAVKDYVDAHAGGGTVARADAADRVSDFFICDASAAPGDMVVASSVVQGKVDVISTNVYPGLVMGIIINKTSITTCEVMVSGKVASGLVSGLAYGSALFIGANGKLTTVPPTTGHLQGMGMAITPTSAFLLPSTSKTVRS
jgi:hypothetical protein